MSTFCGRIKEIPFISVDRFLKENLRSEIFFLSHCHHDHMYGLRNYEFQTYLSENDVFLYASPISIRILKNTDCNSSKTRNKLKELLPGCSTLIKVTCQDEEQFLKVTAIPAGHCPGSVMFLFEMNETVLYTGDFRINAKDLPKYQAFHNSDGSIKKIHSIYLDTTFCDKLYSDFPSREDSVIEVCKLIAEWVNMSSRHIVELQLPYYHGLEYLYMEIYNRTQKQVHPIEKPLSLYKYVKEMNKVISTQSDKVKIHTSLGSIRCCNDYLKNKYFLRTIRPSAMIWENYKPGESIVLEGNNFYNVCYSSHASLQEIREFLLYLKPSRIEACVVSDDLEKANASSELLMETMNEYKK